MKPLGLLCALVLSSRLLQPAEAADLYGPVASHPSPAVVRAVVHRSALRVRVHRQPTFKMIGMPCLLPPDEVVRRHWNGPQCRWVDNIILPRSFRVRRAALVK
jgi:hypothetical protein